MRILPDTAEGSGTGHAKRTMNYVGISLFSNNLRPSEGSRPLSHGSSNASVASRTAAVIVRRYTPTNHVNHRRPAHDYALIVPA